MGGKDEPVFDGAGVGPDEAGEESPASRSTPADLRARRPGGAARGAAPVAGLGCALGAGCADPGHARLCPPLRLQERAEDVLYLPDRRLQIVTTIALFLSKRRLIKGR